MTTLELLDTKTSESWLEDVISETADHWVINGKRSGGHTRFSKRTHRPSGAPDASVKIIDVREPDDYDNANVYNIMCEEAETDDVTFEQLSFTRWSINYKVHIVGMIIYDPKVAMYKALWTETNGTVHDMRFWSLDDAEKAILLSYGQ